MIHDRCDTNVAIEIAFRGGGQTGLAGNEPARSEKKKWVQVHEDWAKQGRIALRYDQQGEQKLQSKEENLAKGGCR